MGTEDDAFDKMYDKAFANGRKTGWDDALTELWDMAYAAHKAGDPGRQAQISDIAQDLRMRWSAVEERHAQYQVEARARLATHF